MRSETRVVERLGIPGALVEIEAGFSTFWYLGYHTLFWLDLYLTGAEEGFAPSAPFDVVEMEEGEALPRTYTRAELLGYLDYCHMPGDH